MDTLEALYTNETLFLIGLLAAVCSQYSLGRFGLYIR